MARHDDLPHWTYVNSQYEQSRGLAWPQSHLAGQVPILAGHCLLTGHEILLLIRELKQAVSDHKLHAFSLSLILPLGIRK